MATIQMSEVTQYIRGAVLLPDGAGMTDGQLLNRFIEGQDEDFTQWKEETSLLLSGEHRAYLNAVQQSIASVDEASLVLDRAIKRIEELGLTIDLPYYSVLLRPSSMAASPAELR